MIRKSLIVLAAGLALAACSPKRDAFDSPYVTDKSRDSGVVIERFYDLDHSVTCYTNNKGGIHCIPSQYLQRY